MKIFNKIRKKKSDDSLWASISDLMSGLMILFLFIAVAFMSQVSKENVVIKQEQKAIKEIIETYELIRMNIYKDLSNEFKDDLEIWKIEIDPTDLSVTFKEPEVFFHTGSSKLKPEFQDILNDFFPRYINIIYGKYKDNIEEVKIEGYTSSEWNKDSAILDSYFANMELSQNRTRNVLKYVMNLPDISEYHDWLIEHITANGMSYSHRHYDKNGNEDKEKSRRVEFRVKTNSEEIISNIIMKYRDKR